MAIFKNKTGRGEVDYTKMVRSGDGTKLFLDGNFEKLQPVTTTLADGAELIFQLRGNSNGVTDLSVAKNTVNEVSGTLVKRLENVTHTQRLKTYEFRNNRVLTLTASVNGHTRSFSDNQKLVQTILPYEGYGRTDDTHCILAGWINIDSLDASNGSCIIESVNEANGKRGFGLILSPTGELIFRYYDWSYSGGYQTSASNYYQQIKTLKSLKTKQWYHFTVFFTGYHNENEEFDPPTRNWNNQGLDSYHQGVLTFPAGSSGRADTPQVQIFINGVSQLVSEAGQTSGAIADTVAHSESQLPLVIGFGLGAEDNGGGNDLLKRDARFNGRLAELSYFKTLGISNASQSLETSKFTTWEARKQAIVMALMTGKDQPTSGITNISERLLLRDLDQHSTHPTVKRSGDQRRLGNHSIKFDDSRAQTLTTASIQYPTKLVQGDNLIETIYEGYFNGDLTLSHTASVESYDSFYRRNDQPAHEPFVESRLFIDNNSEFYQTGTLESVVQGFNGPLHNKDYIVIDLSTSTVTEMYSRTINDEHVGNRLNLLTGFPAIYEKLDPNGENHFTDRSHRMCYWAPATATEPARWELIGTGDRLLSANQFESAGQEQIQELLDTGCIGFGPGNFELTLTGTLADGATKSLMKSTLELIGRPISMFGFPSHPKYHATGSQGILLSDYISEPFLAEKYVLLDVKTTVQGTNNFPSVSTKASWCNKFGLHDFTDRINQSGFRGNATGALPIQSMMSTFFMLRQKKGTETKQFTTKVITPDLDRLLGAGTTFVNPYPQTHGPEHTQFLLTSSIPTTIPLTSGTIEKPAPSVFVDTTRELLGYAQVINYHEDRSDSGFFQSFDCRFHRISMTGSNHPIEINHGGRYEQLAENSDGLLNDGLGRNAAISHEDSFRTALTSVFSMSGSFNATRKYDGAPPKFLFNVYDPTSPRISTNLTNYSTVDSRHSQDVFVNSYEGGRSPGDLTATTSFSSAVVGTVPGGTFEYAILDEGSLPLETGTAGAVTSNDEARAANLFASENFNADANVESAPVVLSPDDKLILGWQCDPGKGRIDKNILQVGGDNAKLVIFGSFLRNSQPRKFQLNQMLNNDIVHEAIGLEPISDQFDIERRGAFAGSYIDEVMSGSVTAPYNGFNASKHIDGFGADDFTDLARRVIGRASEGTQGTTGSLRRNVAIISSDKTELDSFLFDLRGVFKVDERSGVNEGETPGDGRPSSFMLEDNETTIKALIGQDPENVGINDSNRGVRPNVDIGKAYYFARYHNITRVRQEQIGGSATLIQFGVTGSSDLPSDPRVSGLVFNLDGANTVIPKSEYFLRTPESVVNAFDPLNAAKFLFGKSFELNGAYPAKFHIQNSYFVSPDRDLRGFRYGFSNISDKKPRNVFRRDRYGQFRDMLEMAPNTAYVDDVTNTISFSVEAQFFADDGSIAAPDATSCSNLSTNVTSSAPFFDRDVVEFEDPLIIRNRGPFNNKVVDITIEI